MADSNLTKKWENFFKNNGQNVLSIDSTDGFNIKKIVPMSQGIVERKIC